MSKNNKKRQEYPNNNAQINESKITDVDNELVNTLAIDTQPVNNEVPDFNETVESVAVDIHLVDVPDNNDNYMVDETPSESAEVNHPMVENTVNNISNNDEKALIELYLPVGKFDVANDKLTKKGLKVVKSQSHIYVECSKSDVKKTTKLIIAYGFRGKEVK